jgi:hypothetical protein
MELRTWSLRQWLMFGVVFIVVAILVLFGARRYFSPRLYDNQFQSHTFGGQLVQILNDKNLVVKGTFVRDDDPNKSDFTYLYVVTVKVTADTKFIKTLIYMPSQADLKKSGGFWDPANLKKEQQAGSEEDFKNTQGLPLTIKTKDRIYVGDKVITAQEISYTKPVYPR